MWAAIAAALTTAVDQGDDHTDDRLSSARSSMSQGGAGCRGGQLQDSRQLAGRLAHQWQQALEAARRRSTTRLRDLNREHEHERRRHTVDKAALQEGLSDLRAQMTALALRVVTEQDPLGGAGSATTELVYLPPGIVPLPVLNSMRQHLKGFSYGAGGGAQQTPAALVNNTHYQYYDPIGFCVQSTYRDR